ncbi:MAG: SLBB domain-containing protein [candidate division Zixibacteria bacterium]|nr:SLBB domain-containing protein [candidate division Zixibacteria bacterium]
MNTIRLSHSVFVLATALCLALALESISHAQQMAGTADSAAVFSIPTAYDAPIDPELFLLRPGEELRVTFLNSSLPFLNLEVSPDGQIVHPVLGALDVKGATLTQAREKLTVLLRARFKVDDMIISVKAPRPVGVTVTGAVNRPGFYRAYSSQRVSDVIAFAGGVSSIGSTRRIRLSGGPKAIDVDLDRALHLGDGSADPFLYSGYVIEVPARSRDVVQVIGEVLNPRTIELLPNDDMSTLLALSGGITRRADTARIQLLAGINGKDRSPGQFVPGDIIRVPTRDDQRTNTVLVIGEVANPGRFAIQPGASISSVIETAGGSTDKANLSRVTVFRLAESDEDVDELGSRYPIHAAVADLSAIPLKPLDSVFVPRKVGWVRVTGAVRSPGLLPYQEGKDIGFYVSAAGGFAQDADSKNIGLVDRISRVTETVSVNARVQDGDEIVVQRTLESAP